MCGDSLPVAAVPLDDPNAAESLPWSSGRICDAHCHPTDTMASLAQIPGMRAAVLTVMSTRAQDQDLVAQLAVDQGPAASGRVVPAFGWHPWFSYQLYDDVSRPSAARGDLVSMEDKRQHLAQVLMPSPALSADKADKADKKKADEKDKNITLTTALDVLAASLAAIRPLSSLIHETRQRLLAHPHALVGEIGIDKAFRVPEPAQQQQQQNTATPGGREGRRLSPFRVLPAHQVAVLSAQLRLAAELQRPVSVHGVQAHGQLFAALAATWKGQENKTRNHRERHQIAGVAGLVDEEDDDAENTSKDFPPTICLHSFSGPVDMLKQYLDPRIPAKIYFSFSTAVNCSTDNGCARTAQVVAACPEDRILVESDLHMAGPPMDALLEDIYRRVCAIKKWTLAEGVERIAKNYDDFTLQAKRRQ